MKLRYSLPATLSLLAVLLGGAAPAQNFWVPVTKPSTVDIDMLVAHPPSLFFAASKQGGIWKTTNSGASWTLSGFPVNPVSALASNPLSDLLLTSVDRGFYTSTDEGGSWQPDVNSPLNGAAVLSFAVRTAMIMYAGTASSPQIGLPRVFATTDGGQQWTQRFTNIGDMVDLVISPTSGNLFVACRDSGIFRSPDDVTFVKSVIGLKTYRFLSLAANQQGHIFVSTEVEGVYRSTNNGASWTALNFGRGTMTVYDLLVNDVGTLYAATNQGVYMSANNGSTWQQINSGLTTTAIRCITRDYAGHLVVGGINGNVYRSRASTEVQFVLQQRNYSFGDVPVNGSSQLPVTVVNAGTKPLVCSSIRTSNSAFTVAPSTLVIPGGGSRDVMLEFSPRAVGAQVTDLIFTHNGFSSEDTARAIGNGVTPLFVANPTSIAFGSVPVGQSDIKSVIVSNPGRYPLTITDVVSDNGAFSVSPTDAKIPIGGQQTFLVRFDALAPAVFTGRLMFFSDAQSSPDSVLLTGRGVAPEIRVKPAQLSFGDVPVGVTVHDTLIVTNPGGADLLLQSLDIVNTLFSAALTGTVVAPNGTLLLPVSFMPIGTGLQQGKITLRNNAGAPVEIPLDGTGVAAQFAADHAEIDFGDVTTLASKTDSVVVTNDGNIPLVVQSVTADAPFSVTPGTATIPPKLSVVFRIQFSPPATGPSTGALKFTSNAIGSPHNVRLKGNGTTLQVPSFAAAPSALDFGDVVVTQLKRDSIFVRNTGTAPLVISAAQASPGEFFVSPGGATVQPGAMAAFAVSFIPQSLGVKSGSVRFTHNAGAGLDSVPVAGRGVQALRPLYQRTPAVFTMQSTVIGTSRTDTAVVRNPGTALLKVTSVTSSNAAFSVLPNTADVDTQKSAAFIITFTPKAAGLQNADIIFTHNASLTPDTLRITQRGAEPALPVFAVSRDEVNLGELPLGSTRRDSVIVSNPGTAPLVIASIAADNQDFTVSPPSMTLAPGDARACIVDFTPAVAGVQKSVLTFTHNAAPPTAQVTLTGIGVDTASIRPAFALSPQAIEFPGVTFGNTATDSVFVDNPGTGTLDIRAITSSNPVFSIRPSAPLSIAPGGRLAFAVTFAPTAAQNESGVIIFENNADSTANAVWLSGAGFDSRIQISTDHLDFGEVELGLSRDDTVRITNLSEFPLTISSASSTDPQFSVTPGQATLAVFEERSFIVRFSPSSVGVREATLTFAHDASAEPFDVTVTGIGVASAIQVTAGDGREGAGIPLRITLPPGFPATSTIAHFRVAGKREYDSIPLNASGADFAGNIPAEAVGLRGVEYYVAVTNGSGDSLFYPSVDPRVNPAFLNVAVERAPFPGAMQRETYRMISVPAALRSALPLSVLADDLGPYNTRHWRLFHWENGAYAELPAVQAGLLPGAAMWLVTYDGTGFDIDSAVSVNTGEINQIVLQPGWNQIASPYAFPVEWNAILAANGASSDEISNPYFFDGGEYAPGRQAMRAWEGYFVFNALSTTKVLVIPPEEAPPGLLKRSIDVPMEEDPASSLQLVARFSPSGVVERHNFVGFTRRDARSSSRLGVPEPPAAPDQQRLSILRGPQRVMESFLPDDGEGASWDLLLSSPSTTSCALSLTRRGDYPAGYRAYLFDLDAGRAVGLGGETADIGAFSSERRLRLVIGTEAYARAHSDGIALQPLAFAAEEASPNPSRGAVTIRYTLDARASVTADVYDRLGRLVRSLARSEHVSGVYSVVWDGLDDRGRPAESGVYFCRIAAGERVLVRRIAHVR